MVNKIPLEYNNPIDVILLKQCDRDLEFYKNLGFTPNGITTVSLIIGLLSIYNFHYDNYFLAALLFMISYYFDCVDGKMARKYKMYSRFGDLYDHTSDMIKLILLLYIMYRKSYDKFIKVLIVSLVLFTLTLFHSNCQEKIYGKSEQSEFLNFFNIKLEKCEEKIKYFKYIGPGTPMTFLTLCILLWNKI